MKVISRFVGLGMLLLAFAGCAGAATTVEPSKLGGADENGSTITFVEGLLTYELTMVGESHIGLGAQYTGALSFENGCLLVAGAPFVFPREGTTWDGTTLSVNGHEFALGDQLTVGGGGGFDDLKLPDDARDRCGEETPIFVSTIDSPR
ncbi:hypothetical protein IWX89_003664 [Cryobacterium sp. MP_M3]|uniref:hypothetical protein n=1 Tax=unclassified Cryobacterium TaxID=2649013 RepID=UPI0018C94BF9|nr:MULTISPECIES: hypothetical protein [unclassified Cryobacterium]MBG6060190.1 hypothetical protein [Cryobacterium sp. MP_M3]